MDEKKVENSKSDETQDNENQNLDQSPELSEIDQLNVKIAELENNLTFYKDQFLRTVAEFDNYKKRTDNEYANFVRYANEQFIEKLLPVVDDFERSLKALGEMTAKESDTNTKGNQSLARGVELIYNKLKKVLESHGVAPMEVVGKPFDPNYHDALMQVETSDYPHHTVIQEVERGYMLRERVIRHAKVIVSASPAEGDSQQSRDEREENKNG